MKKFLLICLVILLASCSSVNKENNSVLKLLPIDKVNTPQIFIYGTIDTIAIKYSLPNSCHVYHSLYYQYQDTTRIVAVRALEYVDNICSKDIVQKELKFPLHIVQRKDYVFKFWKGKDTKGNDLYEERIIPVN
ncbi:MAG: hypothetical protein ACPGUU_00610 [Flavobacteriaceae bacterium]